MVLVGGVIPFDSCPSLAHYLSDLTIGPTSGPQAGMACPATAHLKNIHALIRVKHVRLSSPAVAQLIKDSGVARILLQRRHTLIYF